MAWAMVCPCAGPSASVLSTSTSNVPCSMSPSIGGRPRFGIAPQDNLPESACQKTRACLEAAQREYKEGGGGYYHRPLQHSAIYNQQFSAYSISSLPVNASSGSTKYSISRSSSSSSGVGGGGGGGSSAG